MPRKNPLKSGQKGQKKPKPRIYKDKWYILDLTKIMIPRILPFYFTTYKLAKNAIRRATSTKARNFFKPIEGRRLSDYNIPTYFKRGKWGMVTKYIYNSERRTARKNERTIHRRRLRRMGLYSTTSTKRQINQKPKYIKHIPNTQEIAKNPGSSARFFKLFHKPKNIYYYLVSSGFSNKAGKLFRLRIWKIDIKKETIEKGIIETNRTDLIIPYIIKEFLSLIKNKTKLYGKIIRKLEKEGFKNVQTKPQRVI